MRLRKLLAAITVASLLLGLVGTAAFAQADVQQQYQNAVQLLTQFRIVEGDPDGNLRPLDPITRAEMTKILVVAAGQGENAKLLQGAPSFSDVPGDAWYSGYAALAKNAGWANGYPDGTFHPDQSVSYAEVVAFLVKFVGLQPAAGTWPNNFITAGEQAGIVDPSLNLRAFADASANRGSVFILADSAFSNVPGPDGKNIYQRNQDAEPPTVTVDAVTSPTADATTTISGMATGAASVFVNGTQQTLGADGSFSAVVDLTVGANEIMVTAVDLVGNEATKTVSVTRNNTAIASIEVDAALEVEAGATAKVAAVAKDTNGAVVPDAVLAATVTGDVGTYDAATGEFTAATTAGSGTLTLSAGDVTADVAVTVKAGEMTKIEVSPSTANLKVGSSQKFTAKGLDQYGNEVSSVTATWSTDSAKGVIDQSGNFAATSAGTVTVTAVVGEMTGTATVSAFGAATKLTIGSVSELVANGKSKATITVTAQDANGNAVNDYAGTVTLQRPTGSAIAGFVATDGTMSAANSKAVVAANGVATFEVISGTTAGDVIFSGTASGLTGATATLSVKAQTISSISVAADPASVAADGQSTSKVKVKLLDQSGQPFVGADVAGWTGTFTSSDTTVGTVAADNAGAAVVESVTSASKVIYATVTAKNNIGSTTISVTVKKGAEDKFTGSTSVSTVLVGEPYKIVADTVTDATARQDGGTQKMTVVFRIQDVNGNQVTKLNNLTGLALTLTANDNQYTVMTNSSGTVQAVIPVAGLTISSVSNNTNVSMSAGKLSIYTASAKAQTVKYTLSGTYTSGSAITLQKGEVEGTFVPGDAAKLLLSPSPSDAIAASETVTVYGYVKDNAPITSIGGGATAYTSRNTVTSGSYDITFSRDDVNSVKVMNWSGSQTVTSSAGVASVSVTAGNTLGSDRFKASFKPDGTTTVWGTDSGGSNQYVTVSVGIHGSPYQLYVSSTPSPNAKAGATHSIYVKVKDATNATASLANTVTDDNSTVVTLTLKDSLGTERFSSSATAARGMATFTVSGLTKSDTYSISAAASGLKSASTTYVVDPGSVSQVTASLGSSTIAANTGSSTTLTVWGADEYGNKRSDALTGVTVESSDTGVATVGAVSCPGTAANNCTVTLTGTANIGSTTLTAKKSGLTSWTGTLTTVIAGDAKNAVVEVAEGGKVGLSSAKTERQKVVVKITDASGNLVTTGASQRWVKLALTGTSYTTANTVLYKTDGSTSNGQLYNWQQTSQGMATFYLNTSKAGTVTYTATIVDGDGLDTQVTAAAANTTSGSSTGTFVAGSATKVSIGAPAPTAITGDGSSITQVEAKVTDAFGNHAALAGKFTFTLSSQTFAYISGAASDGTLTVDTADGKATVIVQARQLTPAPAPGGTLTVRADFSPTDTTKTLNPNFAVSATLTVNAPNP